MCACVCVLVCRVHVCVKKKSDFELKEMILIYFIHTLPLDTTNIW